MRASPSHNGNKGRKKTEVTIGSKNYFPIELENILYQSHLNGVWYQIKVTEDMVHVIAEHRNSKDYSGLENEIASNFEKALNQKVTVELKPSGSLYNYKEIRPGKPLSRIVDVKKGKSEIVEGA